MSVGNCKYLLNQQTLSKDLDKERIQVYYAYVDEEECLDVGCGFRRIKKEACDGGTLSVDHN